MAAKSLVVIYIYGCATCGRTGRHVRRAMKYCHDNQIDLEIKYSSHDEENRSEHGSYLIEAKIKADGYPAIVVHEGKVAKLSEWNM